jgi:hypothetical protein
VNWITRSIKPEYRAEGLDSERVNREYRAMRLNSGAVPLHEVDVDDDRALADAIHQRYYEMSVDVLEAAMMEFTPTSTHRMWMGKYRCFWCKQTGYVWPGPNNWWWGHGHGRNCRKRGMK